MNPFRSSRTRVQSMAVVLVTIQFALSACASEDLDRIDLPDLDEPLPIEGPLFSVSEGGSPSPFVVNVAQAGAILEDHTSIVFNYNEALAMAFDTAGDLQFLAGRRGQGPGEFSGGVGRVLPVGDGFGAWDSRSRRFSFFSQSGEFTHDLALTDWRNIQPIGWIHGLGLMFAEYDYEPGLSRQYIAVDTLGSAPRVIHGPAAPPRFDLRYPTGERSFASIGVGFECIPALLAAVIADGFYVAESATGTIHKYSNDGTTEAIYSEANRSVLTNEVIERVKAEYSFVPIDSVMSYVRAIGVVGDSLPTWSAVVTDESLGVILLRETRCGWTWPSESTWTAVSDAGEIVGRIVVPPSTMVLAARHGRLLLVRRDELGVEFAELYELPDEIVGRLK